MATVPTISWNSGQLHDFESEYDRRMKRRREKDVLEPRKRFFHPNKVVVTLKSRYGQKVQVDNESDRQFLELADKFVIAAEKIERDPTQKMPRLSLR